MQLIFRDPKQMKRDILSGLTVALALVPEAVAFAFVAGVQPLVGLYAAFMVGLVTAVIGGRPGMISGATGALAVVMVALVAEHGVQYLFATVVLMGGLQVLAGLLKLGRFIRMVPHPVMLGFVNGLAIVIFLAQLGQFGTGSGEGWLAHTFLAGSVIDVNWLPTNELLTMLLLVGITMFTITVIPRFTKAVPASLVAILGVSVAVFYLSIDTKTVGDVASIGGGLPSFAIPKVPFSLETLTIIFPYALILAAIGLIESLLTLRLIDEYTQTRGKSNQECIGQGVANIFTGFFGGMGGCAMIGQSMINVSSGGRGRLSGVAAALSLLAFILVGSTLIEQIPIAALIGVMFIVVIKTFEWSSLRIMKKIPRADAFVIVLVSAVTVMTDLALAVFVGVIVAALVFAWDHAMHIRVTRHQLEHDTYYVVTGPLFFGSTTHFLESFEPHQDHEHVYVDFQASQLCDHSGLDAIDTLVERYTKKGKQLHLLNVSEKCQILLQRADGLVEVPVVPKPDHWD